MITKKEAVFLAAVFILIMLLMLGPLFYKIHRGYAFGKPDNLQAEIRLPSGEVVSGDVLSYTIEDGVCKVMLTGEDLYIVSLANVAFRRKLDRVTRIDGVMHFKPAKDGVMYFKPAF